MRIAGGLISFVVELSFALSAFSSPAVAAPLESCQDPYLRQPMSVLNAAFFGPLFSAAEFNNTLERFRENAAATSLSQVAMVPAEAAASPENYLREIQFQSQALMVENITRMMWEVDEKIPAAQIPHSVSLKVCRDCRAVVREKLRDYAATVVEDLRQKGYARKSWAQVADEFNTDAQAFRQILEALRTGMPGLSTMNYWQHRLAMTTEGPNLLWQTHAARELLHLPSTPKELYCVLNGACELPPENAFTALNVGRVLHQYYDQFTDHATRVTEIASYFRYFPKAAARVVAMHPNWEAAHCQHLAEALNQRGQDQNNTLDVREVSRLAPMAVFWSMGLGSGIIKGGRISPLTFSIVMALQYVDVAERTYAVMQDQKKLSVARTSLFSGQMDEETWLRHMSSEEHLEKDVEERDEAALEAVGATLAAAAVARITTYGWRGALSGQVTPQIVSKYRYSGEVYEFLKSRGVRTTADIEKLLAKASPAEMKTLRGLVKSGYELTTPAMLIALKETWLAFNFTPYNVEELQKGL